MNAPAKIDEQSANVADYGTSLMEVIAKAARDPNVDIDKMEAAFANAGARSAARC